MDNYEQIKLAVIRMSKRKYNRQSEPQIDSETGLIYHDHRASKREPLYSIKGLTRLDASPVSFTRGLGYYA